MITVKFCSASGFSHPDEYMFKIDLELNRLGRKKAGANVT